MAEGNLESARALAGKYHKMLSECVESKESLWREKDRLEVEIRRIHELLDAACSRDEEARALVAADDLDGLRRLYGLSDGGTATG